MGRDAIEGNLEQVLRDLRRRIDALERRTADVGQLDELARRLGLIDAGEFRSGNGVEPGEGFSGMRMNEAGVNGYNNDVLQAGISSADGKLTAGAGAVTLDNDGINIVGNIDSTPNAIKFFYDSSFSATHKISEIRGYEHSGLVHLDLVNLGKLDEPSTFLIRSTGRNASASEFGEVKIVASDGTNTRTINLNSLLSYVNFIEVGLKVNSTNADIDSYIHGTSGPVITVDAGNNKAIITTADITTADITTANITTANIGVAAFDETGVIKGGGQSISDDGVYSFTPATARGILVLRGVVGAPTEYAIMVYAAISGTAYAYAMLAGSNTVVTTGALTGTTGTDGKLTISAHTDGKIYIENRCGVTRTYAWNILAGA